MAEGMQTAGEHPTASDFEGFVTGALVGTAETQFTSHVSACEACSERLATEAQLEERLHQLAESRVAQERPRARERTQVHALRPRRAPAVAAVAVVVAAAAAVMLLTRAPTPKRPAAVVATPPPSAIPAVVCADLEAQAACIEQAHRRGLFVRFPTGAGAPPIGGASTGGPSTSPFPISRRTP